MKNLFTLFILMLLVFALGVTGCTSQGSQPPSTQTPLPNAATDLSSTIVLDMVERLNAGDLEGSLAYFADDAMGYIVGMPPTGMEIYAGKEKIRSLWKDSVDNHFKWEVESSEVDGNVVHVRAKTWHDFTRQLGVAPLEWNDVYEVEGGKIITYSTTITADSLAKLKPALAKVMPPEPTVVPSSNSPVSELTVTIAGGTCTTDNVMPLQAGEIKATLDIKDQNKSLYALTVFNLKPGKDFADLMASTVGMPPSWADMLLFQELGPGKSETYTFTVEKGPVYLVCWSKPPDLAIGNAGPFEVVDAAAAASTIPASSATVTWEGDECTYDGPNPIPAGMEMPVEWVVKDIAKPVYYFEALTLLDGKTREYLIQNYGSSIAGSFYEAAAAVEVPGGSSKQYSIRTTKGPIYIACFNDASSAGIYRFIGPLDVTGATP